MIQTTTPTQPQTEPPILTEYGGYPVYAMPVFATVAATDVERTATWFRDALGLGIMFVALGPGGAPSMVHLRRARYQDLMVVPAVGSPAPGSAVTVTFQAGEAADIDRMAAVARAVDPQAVEGPYDTPWNTRELAVTDPDGNRFAFTGRGTQPTEDFAVVTRRLSGEGA